MTTPHLAIAAVYAQDWIAVRPTDRPRISRGELLHVLRCGVDTIDVRIENVTRGPSQHERALAELALSEGLRLRCHAWLGQRDPSTGVSSATHETGLRQGAQLGRAADKIGAESAAANTERDTWRGVGGKANPRGAEVLDGIATAFFDESPRRNLDHCGFADPRVHYGRTDVDRDGRIDAEIPEEVARRYKVAMVMAYQSTLPACERRMELAAAVWTHQAATHLEPWVGCGRIDPEDGQVGDARVTATLARRYGRVCIYVGGGAMPMLISGHVGHPSVVSLVRTLKSEAS